MDEKIEERKVFIALKPTVCGRCKEELGKRSWIELAGKEEALCIDCSELGKLDFLPAGNAALTRRSKKYSEQWAVVLKWSRARKRYERQGLLVESQALEQADSECLLDEDTRREKRKKSAQRRAAKDQNYVTLFAENIREIYPNAPPGEEQKIAEHACRIHSGRVGRTAMAKELDRQAIRLAVAAHVRHNYTDYESLLGKGRERYEVLQEIGRDVRNVLDKWMGEEKI